MADFRPQTIRGYELRERIGAGGYGIVYRAAQAAIEREVAVKVILPQYANQVDFIRLFEAEARLVARLEHPHIVPLYDYWRDPSGAYLVMRYLRGGSLRKRLAAGRFPLPAALTLLDQIASALDAAHRRNVVHRDVKPDNIMLDDDGHAYLSDFGIAKLILADDLPGDQALSGSLGYLAPEQARGQVAQASDLYSFGVVAYEILTGQHPFADLAPSSQMLKHLTEPLPPLSDSLAPFNDAIQKITAKDPATRYPDAQAFIAALRAVSLPSISLTTPGGPPAPLPVVLTPALTPNLTRVFEILNPYKGLRPFEETDAADFFGRDTLIQRLLERLAPPSSTGGSQTRPDHRFLAVIGPSGSGKSSVVKAGLLPMLRKGGLLGSARWLIAEFTPGADPMAELENALLQVAARPVVDLRTQLYADRLGLARVLPRLLPEGDSELVLVIDQFEEIFTQALTEAKRAQFLNLLHYAITLPDTRLHLIITLRADFYDKPLMYPGFGELIRLRTEVVLPLAPAELEETIVSPAERVGVIFERGLAADIAADVSTQPGALPLLEYALTELFEKREGRLITRAVYKSLGGVLGALARRAEEIYQTLDPASQAAAQIIFPRLVTLGEGSEDTRRRVLRSELESLYQPPKASAPDQKSKIKNPQLPITNYQSPITLVLNTFGNSRLLSFDRDPATRAPIVEVAHEALIREWPTLRGWLNDNRDGLRLQRHLTQTADEWNQQGRAADELYRGARLAQAREWAEAHPAELNALEREFLAASLALAEQEEAAREQQHQRELEAARHMAATAQKLAETETARAEEQAKAAGQLRRWGRGLVVALGTAVLLLVAALVLGVVANQQRQAAERNFTHSEILRLAAEANTQLLTGANLEVSPLLAIQSLKLGYSPEADAVLQRAVTYVYPAVKFVGHTNSVFGIAFSADGARVATASTDQTARVWDTATGAELQRFTSPGEPVNSVAFSPDGQRLAYSTDVAIHVWDLTTEQELLTLTGHTGNIWTVVFSPDGQTLLSASVDETVRLWDAATGKALRVIEGGTGFSSATFSPDGRYIAGAGDDALIHLWDARTGVAIRQFHGHSLPVIAATFSPDGTRLVSASDDKTARVWDVATGAELRQLNAHQDSVYSAVFSPDGRFILTASLDRVAMLWEAQTGALLRQFVGHRGSLYSAVFAPDGRHFLTGSLDQTAWLWPTSFEPKPARFNATSPVLAVALSPDGRYVLTGHTDPTVHLWEAATGVLVRSWVGHTFDVSGVEFSADGRYAVTASGDTTARMWEVTTGQELKQFKHDQRLWVARFSPDGRYLLTGGDNRGATLWDVATTSVVRHWGTTPVYAVAFSPDGKQAATGGFDGRAHVWEVATGAELASLAGTGTSVYGVAFSPDGKTLALAERTLRLFDWQTGVEIRQLPGHTASIVSITFSPDGRYLLSGSEDGSARLWDVATGAQLRAFTGQQGLVYAVAFTPDGQRALIGSADNSAWLWDLDYHGLIDFACAQSPRDFTLAERQQFGITSNPPTCATP